MSTPPEEQEDRKRPALKDPPDPKRLKTADDVVLLPPDEMPRRGCVTKDGLFYCAKANETLGQIADKLGASWKDMAENATNKYVLMGNCILQ